MEASLGLLERLEYNEHGEHLRTGPRLMGSNMMSVYSPMLHRNRHHGETSYGTGFAPLEVFVDKPRFC